MTSKAFELAKLGNAYSDGALSNRNLIINGAMQVWQRGTSHSTSGYGSVDRWQQLNNTLLSRSTDAPTDEGFQYSSKVDFAGNADSNFVQNIENGIGLTSGKSVTLSFWAKATGSITRFENIFFINNTNFGVITSPPVSITNTWQRHTLTVTIPSYPASQYSDTLQIRFDLDPLESGSYYITGVQLEVGDTATPFEHRSYGDELVKCYRYFFRHERGNVSGSTGSDAYLSVAARGGNGSTMQIPYQWPVPMRTKPTLSFSATSQVVASSSTSTTTNTGFAADSFGLIGGNIQTTGHSGLSSDTCVRAYLNESGKYVDFDAEL